MSIDTSHLRFIENSAFASDKWNDFAKAEETKDFRQLRLKHDLHIEAIAKKFAGVMSGDTELSFEVLGELRDGMLRLYQLAMVYEKASTKVGEQWLGMAGEINAVLRVRVSEVQASLARVHTWVKRIEDLSEK